MDLIELQNRQKELGERGNKTSKDGVEEDGTERRTDAPEIIRRPQGGLPPFPGHRARHAVDLAQRWFSDVAELHKHRLRRRPGAWSRTRSEERPSSNYGWISLAPLRKEVEEEARGCGGARGGFFHRSSGKSKENDGVKNLTAASAGFMSHRSSYRDVRVPTLHH